MRAINDVELMQVKKISGAIGAELSGLDLSRGLNAEGAAEIRKAFLAHQVIFIKDQHLSPQQFIDFARHMGEPIEYPFLKGLDDFPQIIEVKKLEHETVNFGGIWHSDTTYLDVPPMGSMLLSREVPPFGGDTMFANQYMAYETLSSEMRRIVDPLIGISSSAKADVSRTREDRIKSDGIKDQKSVEYRAEHPVVRTHPETGRKALFVNVAHTVGIKGLSDDESTPLLRYLFEHQVRPEFTCRFTWQPHTIAFWDNRCAQHNPVNDYNGFRRVMLRITLRGERPV